MLKLEKVLLAVDIKVLLGIVWIKNMPSVNGVKTTV